MRLINFAEDIVVNRCSVDTGSLTLPTEYRILDMTGEGSGEGKAMIRSNLKMRNLKKSKFL